MPSFVSNKTQVTQQPLQNTNFSFGPKFGNKFLSQQTPKVNRQFNLNRPINLKEDEDNGESSLPRFINYNADQGGCGLWRIIWPSEYMLAYKKATVMNMYQLVLEPYFYKTIDAIKFQRQCKDNQMKLIEHIKKVSTAKEQKTGQKLKILWEVDDLVAPADCIPDFNKSKTPFNSPEILENLKRMNDYVDEYVVVSNYMKEHYEKHAGFRNVSVIPNYLPPTWLKNHYNPEKQMINYSKNKNKPRIGYIGSASHFDVRNNNQQKDDLYHIFDYIIKTVDKFQWVFVGGYPLRLHPLVKSGAIEFHPWVPILELHSKVAELNLTATIAPLSDHVFNRAKSDIKMMESAALGLPCVCQDLEPYEKAIYKFTDSDSLDSKLNEILFDENSYKTAVEESYKLTNNRWLNEHIDEHVMVYTTEWGSDVRKENKWFLENNPKQFQ